MGQLMIQDLIQEKNKTVKIQNPKKKMMKIMILNLILNPILKLNLSKKKKKKNANAIARNRKRRLLFLKSKQLWLFFKNKSAILKAAQLLIESKDEIFRFLL